MHNYEFLFYFIPRTTVVPDLVRITVVIPYEGFTVPKSHLYVVNKGFFSLAHKVNFTNPRTIS